ncbi:MAG: hypothetical protein C4289_00700 [Chloroflexota bacterium]
MLGTRSRLARLTALAVVLMTGCSFGAPFGGAAPQPTPTVAPRPVTQQTRPTAQVVRGTIAEQLKVLGRIASAREVLLYFRSNGRLRDIKVETGQTVEEGQVLAELETGTLLSDIQTAQVNYDIAVLRVQQEQARQRDQQRANEAALVQTQASVQAAEIGLRNAQLALEKLRSGPLPADIAKAEADVATARANLLKARNDLALKQAGPLPSDVKAAEAAVAKAYADYLKAQNDLAVLQAGSADAANVDVKKAEADVAKAESDLASAEAALQKTQSELEKLRNKPDPAEVAAARAVVQQKAAALDQAMRRLAAVAGRDAPNRANEEAAVKQAQADLQVAQANLELKSQPATPQELAAAEKAVAALQADVNVKRANVDAARARLEVVRAVGGNLEQARNAVESARAAYESARAKLELVKAGPTPEEIEAAQNAVRAAEEALAAAEGRLEALRAGANEYDLKSAENAVAAAQIALDKAKADYEAKAAALGIDQYSIPLLQKQAELARIALEVKKSQWIDAQIVAPFKGRIRTINGRPGDQVQAYTPVIVMEDPSDLLIRADIQEADVPKLAVGQKADITLDAFPSVPLVGTIVRLPTAIVTQQGLIQDKSTHIRVDWPGPGAEPGQLARVTITIQQKDDVLKVPRSAVKTIGRRTFVEYFDGQMKRSANVETGIASDTEIEIVRGLQEGQTILLGQ